MTTSSEISRIREEARAICDPYKIQISQIDELPEAAGGGFAINISLPSSLTQDVPDVEELRSRLEGIKGVQKVFVVLARK